MTIEQEYLIKLIKSAVVQTVTPADLDAKLVFDVTCW